jgi:DNA-binding transcriptional LysR family regulator
MNLIECLQIFRRVAELTSFTQAAERLGLPKASVSSAVQQLENHLGTRLLHRTTRRVQLTQDGQVFYERCQDLLADIDEMQAMFQLGEAAYTGRLRVDMPVGVARHLVVPQLPQFLTEHPGIQLEVGSTDRRVDLVREGFDCVLRVGQLADSSLVARPLGCFRTLSVASPAYLQRYGVPQALQELQQHRLIGYAPLLGSKPEGFEYVDATGQAQLIDMPLSLVVNNSEAYRSGCLAGLGIIQAPDLGLREDLEQGRLVEVLPQWRPAPMPVSLLYANRRHLPKRVQVFMAWMAELLRPYLL